MDHTDRKRTNLVHARIARRDGWICVYCACPLAHGSTGREYAFTPDSWTHCGCGKHDLSVEPCPGGWFYRLVGGHRDPEIDHVIARSRGGGDQDGNLVLACGPCNVAKSNTPVEEFLLELIGEAG